MLNFNKMEAAAKLSTVLEVSRNPLEKLVKVLYRTTPDDTSTPKSVLGMQWMFAHFK